LIGYRGFDDRTFSVNSVQFESINQNRVLDNRLITMVYRPRQAFGELPYSRQDGGASEIVEIVSTDSSRRFIERRGNLLKGI